MSSQNNPEELREAQVLRILERYPYGASQKAVAIELGVSEVTIAKILAVMVAKKLIVGRPIGAVNLHYLPRDYKPEVPG